MNTGIYARTIWRGILGIIFEIFLVVGFMAAGFLLCLLWWKVIR